MRTKFLGGRIALCGIALAVASISSLASSPAPSSAGGTRQPNHATAVLPGRTLPGQEGTEGRQGSSTVPTAATSRLKLQFKTPFERYVAPRLTQMLKSQSGTSAKPHIRQFDTTGTGSGSTANFPSFVAAPFYTIDSEATGDGSSVTSSVSGDFNNDGKLDFVMAQEGGSITTFLNPGNFQNFSNAIPLPPNTSLNSQIPYLSFLTAVDINGDGNLDLVGQDDGEFQIVVWLGHGDGTFGDAVTYPVAPQSGASWFEGGALLVGDFNGDGHPDLAATTFNINFDSNYRPSSTTISVQTFLNKGDSAGTFIVPKTESDTVFQDFYYSHNQQAAVVTTDGTTPAGIAFLIFGYGTKNAAHAGESVVYIASNGDGTFTAPIEPTASTIPAQTQDYGIGSFFATNLSATISSSAKRKGTVAASSSPGSPTTDIVFINGDGAVYDIPFKPATTSMTLPAPTILAGANQFNLSPAFASSSTGKSRKSAISSKTASLPVTGSPIPNIGLLNLADMNNDGILDLIVYTTGSTLVYPGLGNGAFGAPAEVVGGVGGSQQSQPADYDGSGFNSFFWTDAYLNHIGYYQNLGATNPSSAGQFYAAPPVSGSAGTYNALGGNILVQDAGDFNGDGLLDVIAYDLTNVAANGYPDVVLGINNGHSNTGNQVDNFTFTTVIPGTSLYSLNAAFVEPVTIRGNTGNSFLLATYGGLLVYTADAKGNFGSPSPLGIGVHLDCPVNYADSGDINGDGVPDIVVAYGGDAGCEGLGSTPSGYFTFLGTGSGAFQPGTFTPLGGSLYMVKLINFSGALGNLDLAADDFDNIDQFYSVYTIPNSADGSGTFNTDYLTENATGYVVSDIIPGDFNQDGLQDLTLTTSGQNVPGSFSPVPDTTGVLLLPSIGTQGFFSFGYPNLIDAGYYALWGSYADFNGDGYPDLAVSVVNSSYGLAHPLRPPPDVSLVQILPNLHGAFGPVLTELDSAQDVQATYTFTGNFGNTGGNDLLISSNANTAEFLNQGANTLTLTASSATASQGTPVTLTATLSQATSGAEAATGTVTFTSNGTAIGAAPLSSNVATITTSSLPVGTSKIQASYSGDEQHNASSATATVSIGALAPMFTLAASPGSLSVQQGATGTITLNLASNATFSGPISFACSGATAEASCTVNPASLTLAANQSGNVSVVIATTAKNNQYQASNHAFGKVAGGLSLAGLMLFIAPRRRRFLSTLGVVVFALMTLGSLAALSGCGSGNRYPGTPVGNSTITVTATSGSITQTQTIALAVTKAN